MSCPRAFVVLHGFSASVSDVSFIADALKIEYPDACVVTPSAPIRKNDVCSESPVPSWYTYLTDRNGKTEDDLCSATDRKSVV